MKKNESKKLKKTLNEIECMVTMKVKIIQQKNKN